jgi:putative oxidoreductase
MPTHQIQRSVSLIGRILVAYLFIGAASFHLSHAHWNETVQAMRTHGVPFAPVLLVTAMLISSAAAIALVFLWKASAAAYVLATYSVVVSLVLHNPWHPDTPVDFILFVKDLAISGALLALAGAISKPARPAPT